jgi:hypothetical protein
MKISSTDKGRNVGVLKLVEEGRLQRRWILEQKFKKSSYAGHILRESFCTYFGIGKIYTERERECRREECDVCERSSKKTSGGVKRLAADRET